MRESRGHTIDPVLRVRLTTLFDQGWEIWERFDREVRRQQWHPFIPADYESVLDALLTRRGPGLRFLEWGSATGVITIMADLLGFESYGIEIDDALVRTARRLAETTGSSARFATGSFLPAGYRWRSADGDSRTGTIGQANSGYIALGRPLEEFDIVFGYPWDGEAPMMLDLMRRYGGSDALFLLNRPNGIHIFRAGRALHRIA